MSDFIPMDVVIEILLRSSVKTLLRFTAVCKSWRSIITSSKFISSHHSYRKESVLLFNTKRHSIEHYLLNANEGKKEILEQDFPLFLSQLSHPRLVGSSKGWICVLDQCVNGAIILWNPSIRKHIILPDSTSMDNFEVLGLYVTNNFDFKVLKISNSSVWGQKDVEIYAHNLGTWRSLNSRYSYIFPRNSQTSLIKGTLYWPIFFLNNEGYIIAFDTDDEIFRQITLPDDHLEYNRSIPDVSVTTIEGSLGVIMYGQKWCGVSTCSVWVTKDYGFTNSWTKLYNLHFPIVPQKVFGFTKNGEVLFRSLGGMIFTYNLETMVTEDIAAIGYYSFRKSFYIYNYIESLIMFTGKNVVSD